MCDFALSGEAPKRKAWERKLWEKVKLAMNAAQGSRVAGQG